ncbi:WG repeat-containing protein [Odoribacter lunatus]|uniref:WG repeat-containing protein n=1 Tax=Odoribacter lunatus TaxID=2941335 RepID=UPI00203CD34A|nr:WG repeat-containing protein [Odoribacter lunatus]
MNNDLIIFQENGLFGAKYPFGKIAITPKYREMYPFSCGLSLVRNEKYQYAYINIVEKPIVPFGKYIWCDPQFVYGYARIKLMDNIHWGVIDTLGKIAIYPNLDYISPLKAFKTKGNNYAVEITGRYKGEKVACTINPKSIDPISRLKLPINFEFEPDADEYLSSFEFESDLDLEKYLSPKETTTIKRNNLFTSDNNYESFSLDEKEEWENKTLDAFEGDERIHKVKIIFQEYDKVEIKEIDELFYFSILFHDKWSSRNTIQESEYVVVALCRGVSRICLTKINQKDYLIIDDGISNPWQIEEFLARQCDSDSKVTAKMLYHAIYDSTARIFPKMRLTDIYYNYDWLAE